MKTYTKTFTPEEALATFRAFEGKNWRRHDHRRSRLYARDMAAGRWQMNGEAIKFNGDGTLVDGQHRLFAVHLAGVPIEFLVVEGVTHDAVPSMDSGKKRSVNQYLAAIGVKNASAIASTLRLVGMVERRGDISSRGAEDTLQAVEAIDLLKRHPGVKECVSFTRRVAKVMPAATVATCCYLGEYLPNGGETFFSKEFVEGICTGSALDKRDPRLRLRDRMLADKNSKSKLPTIERNALVVLAWNAWVEERELGVLKWASSGPRKGPFPKISQAPLYDDGEKIG